MSGDKMLQNEIEAKFLSINHDDIRDKLKSIGAICEQPMRMMHRATFDNEFMKDGKDSFLRVRDEGDKVTMTYKQFGAVYSVDGAKEIEVTVSDFESTIAILEQTGLPPKSIQQSKRETWRLGSTEIVLDEWPWLEPYIEIEGESEDDLRAVADSLVLDWNNAVFGDVMAAYRQQYPHLGERDTVASITEVKFDAPLPDLLQNG